VGVVQFVVGWLIIGGLFALILSIIEAFSDLIQQSLPYLTGFAWLFVGLFVFIGLLHILASLSCFDNKIPPKESQICDSIYFGAKASLKKLDLIQLSESAELYFNQTVLIDGFFYGFKDYKERIVHGEIFNVDNRSFSISALFDIDLARFALRNGYKSQTFAILILKGPIFLVLSAANSKGVFEDYLYNEKLISLSELERDNKSCVYDIEKALKESKLIDFRQHRNFDFLKKLDKRLFYYASEAERKFIDGLINSNEFDYCRINIGKFTERFVSIVIKSSNLNQECKEFCNGLGQDKSLFCRIKFLSKTDIPSQITTILHKNRIARNPSTHDNEGSHFSTTNCLTLLQNIFFLSSWLANNFKRNLRVKTS